MDLTTQIFPLASDRFSLTLWHQADEQWQWWWQTGNTPETPVLLQQLDDLARANGYEVNRLVLNQEPVTAWVKLVLAPQTSEGLVSDVAAVYEQRGDRSSLHPLYRYCPLARIKRCLGYRKVSCGSVKEFMGWSMPIGHSYLLP